MKSSFKPIFLSLLVLVAVFVLAVPTISAQGQQEALQPYIESVEQAEEGMTLWEMIQAGGFIMMILLGLSILTATLVVYSFMTIIEKKQAPTDFSEKVIQKLEIKDEAAVKSMCQNNENIVSRIILAGLAKKKRGEIFAKEAMENTAKKEISLLWQSITYLADIAAIAPLIGLLGTVLGMIQAFNVIAFQTAVVKPILLAGGVSKAMVTTAGGLIVAIPTMMFYSYFRGRVKQISDVVENYSTDIIKLMGDL